jgi:hypothetical protein
VVMDLMVRPRGGILEWSEAGGWRLVQLRGGYSAMCGSGAA